MLVTPGQRAAARAHAGSRPFQARVRQAELAVVAALGRMARPYIAFSAGKDSTVVADLVWRQDATVPAVYFDADNAFPDTYGLLDRLEAAGRPVIRWPTRPFLEILREAGGPTAAGCAAATMEGTVYAPIRALLAAHGFDGVFLGLRAAENRGRRMLAATRGLLFHNARDGIWECLPIAWWGAGRSTNRSGDADVWAYIARHGLDYNRTYDLMGDLPERERRVSYWAGETYHRHGRWVWLRRHFPDLWRQYAAAFPDVARYT